MVNGKPLLPTLRSKKRYVVYETMSESEFLHRDVHLAIEESFKRCFGIFEHSKAGIVDCMYMKNKGILKINHNYVDKLRMSMAMITRIGQKELILRTVKISGILKKAKSSLGG
jgi:ribonuclease P/MRP protein subunit POP5